MSIEEDIAEIRNALTYRIDDYEAHAALAALDRLAAAVPRWRDISEAPKDGTTILVWDGWLTIAQWHVQKRVDGTKVGVWACSDMWDEEKGDFRGIVHPTHFQPLPQPPEVKA